MANKDKVCIVGAGFYGLMLADFLSDKYEVEIFEQAPDVMTKGSHLCQMRIHSGMMYPRNMKTALSCIHTFKPFMLKFRQAIVHDFTSVYAIARDSKTPAKEYLEVQRSLGQSFTTVKNEIFNPELISTVVACKEYTFDPLKIKQILLDRLKKKKVIIHKNCKITDLHLDYYRVFNCTYAEINNLLAASNLPLVPELQIKQYEKIYYTDNLGRYAICVVDGDYFTTMCTVSDEKTLTASELSITHNSVSRYPEVFARVKKFIPSIKLYYLRSEFGNKAILQSSDNQNRYCNIFKHSDNIYSILGGKVTNVFDMFDELKHIV